MSKLFLQENKCYCETDTERTEDVSTFEDKIINDQDSYNKMQISTVGNPAMWTKRYR